ncbi:MAG: hypothetical protein KDB79_10655 [Acidobacteria bacterium]|nr:hypothetical protein [Acidobacteriota bacterium]
MMTSRNIEMLSKINSCNKVFRALIGLCFMIAINFAADVFPQSIEQNRPTPIVSNQITGEIKARDIGDSRLTTYYYVFNGNRGDIFINVVTKNLNGDIDLFEMDGLVPRTKIVVYADSSSAETGRVVYLRKPEKLLLRIQGRSPDADPATYQIKFAGSFEPLSGSLATNDDTAVPEIKEKVEGAVRVNSVGTIIEEEKAVDENKSRPEDIADTGNDPLPKTNADIPGVFDPRKKTKRANDGEDERVRERIIIEDPFKPKAADTADVTVEIKEKSSEGKTRITIERADEDDVEKTAQPGAVSPEKEAELKAAALQRISLVIVLKDGSKFEKRMSKVSSFNVFDGVLKVVAVDGEVTRFSILDVEKITIQ